MMVLLPRPEAFLLFEATMKFLRVAGCDVQADEMQAWLDNFPLGVGAIYPTGWDFTEEVIRKLSELVED